MDIFISVLIYIALSVGGYLIGSVNNAVIIGKLFFRKDVRQYGSKNAGGTNAARVLGRKAGMSVIVLDVFKTVVVYWLITLLFAVTSVKKYVDYDAIVHFAMITTALGHCYPIYYKFKGGKAVSVVGGFIVATNWVFLVGGLLIFFLLLYWRKMVSFASITTAALLILCSPLLFIDGLRQISFYPFVSQNLYYYIPTLVGLCILLILKHRTNIARLQSGTENKVNWL